MQPFVSVGDYVVYTRSPSAVHRGLVVGRERPENFSYWLISVLIDNGEIIETFETFLEKIQ